MAQTTFNNGDSFLTARNAVNNNASDAQSRLAALETRAYAAGYVTAPVASGPITAGVFINLLTNATVASGPAAPVDFTVDVTNRRLVYTGTATKTFAVSIAISMSSSRSNVISTLQIAKNGTPEPATTVVRKIATGGDVGALSVNGIFSLATNDYIEIFGTLDTSASDTITLNAASIITHQT